MFCCARTQASTPFKCSMPGYVNFANGGTRNLDGISSSPLHATSRRTVQLSAAGCKQLTSRPGYQEVISCMRASCRRVYDGRLGPTPARNYSNGALTGVTIDLGSVPE